MRGAQSAQARPHPDFNPSPALSSGYPATAGDMILRCGAFRLPLSRPLIMGIVNVTPDSFTDGGKFLETASAIAHARRLIGEGADLLDIGGQSTRPGALPVALEQELQRVLPVVEALRGDGVPLSVDTNKAEVMGAALAAGASMINDISALEGAGAMAAVAASDCAVCLMHKQNDPATMQLAPHYDDVVAEVKGYLRARVDAARSSGIARERIVIDPGFGFGKTMAHNLRLLRDFAQFGELGVAVLAGLSRKSTIGKITGREVGERVFGSVAAALLAVERGARVVRVHDVAATRDALAVYSAMMQAQ
jgi:dihydropteroate synthase